MPSSDLVAVSSVSSHSCSLTAIDGMDEAIAR